jgi:hypothetical protein
MLLSFNLMEEYFNSMWQNDPEDSEYGAYPENYFQGLAEYYNNVCI